MLVTTRCTLRAPAAADAPAIAKHANNRGVWLNLRDAFPHPYGVKDAELWIELLRSEQTRCNFIIDVNGEAAGGIGLKRGSDVERVSAELGYWLGEEYWNRGIMSEAVKAISDYGFAHLKLTRIYALPMAHNAASFRVLEKAGFVREGILRRACIKDGKILDMAMYARTSE